MRTICLRAVTSTAEPGAAFGQIAEFERFPLLAPDVHAVETHPGDTPGCRDSDWEVNFRRGIMRWNEREIVIAADLRIEFEQTEGDFEDLRGSWQLTAIPDGTEVEFLVSYDFGIESLAGIMDPIAERVIKRAICSVLGKLFGEVTVLEGGEALSDLGAVPNIPGLITSIGKHDGCTQPIRIRHDLSATQA